MGVSGVVAYVGGYLYLVFFAVCLATGLYYLAELVEEYTRLAKKVIMYTIFFVMILHAAVWLVDHTPLTCVLVGLATHAGYLTMLKTFPFIRLTSLEFVGSVCLLICSHMLWFQHFIYNPVNQFITVEYMLGFALIMVWLVPFGFFISLAANESVLPGVPGPMYGGYVNRGDTVGMGGESYRRETRMGQTSSRGGGSLLGFFKFLMKKRDDVLPSVRAHVPTSCMSSKDRIL